MPAARASRAVAVILGGGELGTGAGHALARAGMRLLIVDRELPSSLRHRVAFATALVEGSIAVAGAHAVQVRDRGAIQRAWRRGQVPVSTLDHRELGIAPDLLIDARMRHLTAPQTDLTDAPVVVGIGPGFTAGVDCHYLLESNRGPRLGAVIARGQAEAYTGVPGDVQGYREERLLRGPCAGPLRRARDLGDFVEVGDVVGYVDGRPIRARLRGMIRGLKLTGVIVGAGHKVGDVDPRTDRTLLTTMTDKALALGAGAVRAATLAGLLDAASAELDAPRDATVMEDKPQCT